MNYIMMEEIAVLIENYKTRIKERGLKDETYKWKLIEEFRGRPNVEAADFTQEMGEIKFLNLVYKMGIAVINHIAKEYPEELRECFRHLFDESIALEERVAQFQSNTLILYRRLEPKLGHHQDERSIATYLTFHDPTKYTLYKNSFYVKYCKLLGIKSNKKGRKYTHYLELVDEFIDKYIKPDKELISLLQEQLPSHYDGNNHLLVAQDILYQMLDQADEEKVEISVSSDDNPIDDQSISLNQILYGPPGTGKTFNTINEAVKIVNPLFYQKHKGDRDELRKEYQRQLIRDWDNPSGRIAFCTFHQSFSYEDFVEGIKPLITGDNQVIYDIEDGVFKRICQRSYDESKSLQLKKEGLVHLTDAQYKQAFFYKISLGDINNPEDKEIYEHCIKNNYISMGFGDQNDFSRLSESEISKRVKELDQDPFNAQMLNYFIHYLQKDNYVVISKGTKYVRALGKVVGDYEYIKESPIRYNHFRKVEWIFTDEEVPVDELYERNLSQQTMYKLDSSAIKREFFVNEGSKVNNEKNGVAGNYVLIIDEINRGNVSSIFGELITLLEPDKRKHEDEELELVLPYSKRPFSVPANVHIIGTMNTADRSIEALDTALRRRFIFSEKPSDPAVIAEFGASGGEIGNIDLVLMLETINQRIEKLVDKDHCIGHAYFMEANSLKDLRAVFENKVIPLLEEYFFGDLGKIGLVLGNAFVKARHSASDFEFAPFDDYDSAVIDDLKQRTVYEITVPVKEDGFISIYQSESEQ